MLRRDLLVDLYGCMEGAGEHYQAVAEVIGYVMRLNRAVGARR